MAVGNRAFNWFEAKGLDDGSLGVVRNRLDDTIASLRRRPFMMVTALVLGTFRMVVRMLNGDRMVSG